MLTIEGHGKQKGRRPINDNPKASKSKYDKLKCTLRI